MKTKELSIREKNAQAVRESQAKQEIDEEEVRQNPDGSYSLVNVEPIKQNVKQTVADTPKHRTVMLRSALSKMLEELERIKEFDSMTKEEERDVKICIERLTVQFLVVKRQFNIDDRSYHEC